jgi:hypothetical protein
MNLKGYVAPIALAFFTLAVGFYLLLGPSPSIDESTPEISSTLDADVLKYFSFKAEQYAKEGAKDAVSQPSQKAGHL